MPSLHADRLGYAYVDAVPLFADARFHLTPGWTGLVGPNGAGKSTLLALLAGERRPTEGRLHRDPPDARVVRCDQDVAAPPPDLEAFAASSDRAVRRLRARLHLEGEAVKKARTERPEAHRDGRCVRAEGAGSRPVTEDRTRRPPEGTGARRERFLHGLGAALARWATLSPGERRRWQIGRALATEPDLLLLDEPTNHLDADARALLVDALRTFRGVGVLVSHDRALFDALCTTTLRLRPGRAGEPGAIEVWPGGWSAARRAWEGEAAARRATHAARADEARRARAQLADARRAHGGAERTRSAGARMKDRHDHDARGLGAQFRADRAGARLSRAVDVARAAHARAVDALVEAPWDDELGRDLALSFDPPPQSRLVALDLPELRAGATRVAGALSLVVGRGDRVRVGGPNGAGKSTLLGALLAACRLPPERILHLPQELPPERAAADLDALRALPPDRRGAVLQLVAALGVDPARLLATGAPSFGEARKLAIALGLGRRAWLAVLDEPTNHLDLPSVERLERALAAWPGALVLVTHDDALAAATTRTTWTVGGGEVCPT